MAAQKTEDQYFEIEVTPPTAATGAQPPPVYSYLRLGTWNDNPNPGAEATRKIQAAASAAAGNPNEANIAALKQAASLGDAAMQDLDAAVAARNTAYAARAEAAPAHDAAKLEYDPKAKAAQTAYEAAYQAKKKYEEAFAAKQSNTALARNKREWEQANAAYERAKAEHETARAKYQPAKDKFANAQKDYVPAKRALLSAINQTVANAGKAAIAAATASSSQKQRGHDLAMRITDFNDDTRNRGPFEHLSEAERMAESAILHTKGGWRDHTEGNRISTTRGDKIEIIGGNYRRMVLGRQDDSEEACRLDASGGLYMAGDFAPGEVVLVEYSTKYSNTWKVVEQASKGDVYSRYYGDVEDRYYGNSVKSFVGQPGGADWENAAEIKPNVEERTWASQITSETHADTIEEQTYACTISETTRVSGAIHSNTTVGAGVVDMLAVGAGLVEMTAVGASHIEMEAATTHIQLELAPGCFDLYVGAKMEVVIGAKLVVNVGPHAEFDMTGILKFTPADAELVAVKNSIVATNTSISGVKNDLSTAVTRITANETAISTAKTNITAIATHVSAAHLIT